MSKEYKLDIFDVLNAVDKRQSDFLERQPEESQKAFAPRVVLRWASAVTGPLAEHYIETTNEFVNVNFDALYHHPELQYRLMALCGAGSRQRHQWIPLPKSKVKPAPKLHEFLGQYHPLASVTELEQLLSMHTRESFEQFLRDAALSNQDTKDLMNAFDKSRGIEIPKAKGKKKA